MGYEFATIYKSLSYSDGQEHLQLQHRMALVNMWAPCTGGRVLEIGCGQGETTVALAAALGADGHVLAVDKAPAEYGRPVTLGEAHAYIKASALGERITFLLSTDVLAPQLDFPRNAFDLVVLAHSSWYMSSPQELCRLFTRVRPWARRFGYAEWDVRPRHMQQLPHCLAVVLQAYMHRIAPKISTANARCLILPEHACALAEHAGWTILETRRVDTSTPLGFGKAWEIYKALEMAEHLLASDEVLLSEDVHQLLSAAHQMLRQVTYETHHPISLSTYAFLAE